MLCRTVSLLCACFGLCVLASYGQTLGDLSGEARDSSGAVVPGVRITLTNVATNASRQTLTNEAGLYNFPAVQPGIYTLRAEKEGFRTFVRTGIEVQVQLSARVDIDLQVGAVTETVEVRAESGLLQTEKGQSGK